MQRSSRASQGGALGVIDLGQIEHLALHHASVVEALVFDDTSVNVLLAIGISRLMVPPQYDAEANMHAHLREFYANKEATRQALWAEAMLALTITEEQCRTNGRRNQPDFP